MINRDLDKIEIPDNIDEFIDKGINKLKREKEKKVKKHYLKVCSMIAILSIPGLHILPSPAVLRFSEEALP